MNRALRQLQPFITAFVVAVVSAAVVANLLLRFRIRELTRSMNEIQHRVDELDRLRARTWDLANRAGDERHELMEMLAICRTRDDFLVREGPWFVRSRLAHNEPRTWHMGVYVPEGRHVLKYSHKNRVTKVALPDVQEVYEVRATIGVLERQVYATIIVLGKNNQVNHNARIELSGVKAEDSLKSYFSQPWAQRVLLLPSELHIDVGTVQRLARKEIPHTDLFQWQSRDFDLRFWCESHAPACMAALEVASEFDIERGALSLFYRNWLTTEHYSPFEPYDGSGRYRFRPQVLGGATMPQ